MEELKTQEEAQEYRDKLTAEMWSDDEPQGGKTPPAPEPRQEPVEQPELKTEPEKDEPSAVEIDPAVKQYLDGQISDRMTVLENLDFRIKQAEKRVGSLQNIVQNPKQKQQPEQPKAPSKEEIAAAAEDTGKWEALKEEYSEFEDLLDEIGSRFDNLKSNNDFEQRLAQERDQLKTDLTAQMSEQQLKTELKFVTYAHPDWQEVRGSREFGEWLNSQNLETQDRAANSNDALEVIDVLNRFKSSRSTSSAKDETPAEINRKRAERLNTSARPHQNRGKTTKTKSPGDMSDDEYRRHKARELWGG